MSFMKWMRKNNTKLMAVVVIVLMIAFIGGTSFSYLMRGSGGAKRAVAYYGHKHKISSIDRQVAENELKLLEELGAGSLLRAQQDLRSILLSQLLFGQSRETTGMMDMVRQVIQRNRYRISEKQIEAMSNSRTTPTDIIWILLREEASSAGIYVPDQEVADLLARVVPQLFNGLSYSQMMQAWSGRYGMPEKAILSTYGKLLAVLQYGQIISSMEDITTSQIRHMALTDAETLDADYVQLEASAFADKQQTPSPEEQTRQFEQYKANFPGNVTEANPFGFGYRLPNRVQFDYIVVKLSDVAGIIKAPTEEETEQYYQQNRSRQFTEKVPANPNDPNSPQVDKVKSYVEVADEIVSQLRRQRITTKAEQILQEAKNLADASLPRPTTDGNEPPLDQLKAKAGSYGKIAQDLSTKYSIPLYNGTTGLLSAADMRGGKYLRRMYLMNYARNPVPLSQVLFSVKPFGESATMLQSMTPPLMYSTVGPFKDPMSASASDVSNQIMLIARVTTADPDAAPANLDVSYSTQTLDLGNPADQKGKLFSVKEQVIKDLQALTAWNTTGAKAEELKALVAKDGWDGAIAQFNKLYGEQAKAEPNDPNVFKLDHRMAVQRIPEADIEVLATQLSNTPGGRIYLIQAETESRFTNRLFSLAPAEPNATSQFPKIMEFRPDRSYYVFKNISMQPLYQEQFQKMKGMVVGREDYSQSQNLAVVYLNPENIVERMDFRWAHPVKESAEDQAKKESKDES